MADELLVFDPETGRQIVEAPGTTEFILVSGAKQGPPGPEGPQGPEGPRGEMGEIGKTGGRIQALAGEPIPFLAVVRQASNGQLYLASSAEPDDVWSVVGVAETNALAGELLTVVQNGILEPGSPFPIGPLFLDEDGSLTPSPSTGVVQLHVADSLTNTTINVRLEPAIHH